MRGAGTGLTLAGNSIHPTGPGIATSLAVSPGFEAETERLLSLRTRDIRMSPEMLRAYRSKTWPQRSTIARSWMIWVGLIAMAFVPVAMGMYSVTIARKAQLVIGQKTFLLLLRDQYRSDALRGANQQNSVRLIA